MAIKDRVPKIQEVQFYELRDGGRPIYRGQTRLPLEMRLGAHRNRRGSSPLRCHIQKMRKEERLNDLEIVRLTGYDTEREAIQGETGLLNVDEGDVEPPPRSYEWSEQEAAMLGEVPDAEIARRLSISEHEVVKARRKLDLPVIDEKYLGNFTNEQVLAIRQQHKNTDLSYAAIAEDWGVCKSTIRDLVRGSTYKHVAHPEFSNEEREQIESMIDSGRGPQSIGQVLSISPSLIERRFAFHVEQMG